MNATIPTLAYLAMAMPDNRFGVFATSSASPEWYRLIAVFHNKERADQYAEVEMMFLDDHDDMDGQWSAMQRAETANAPSATEPPSAVRVGAFVRREVVEIPAAPAPEEITLPTNEIRALPPETASEEITPAPATPTPSEGEGSEGQAGRRALLNAADLPPLTKVQFKIFAGFVSALKGTDDYVTVEKIASAAGVEANTVGGNMVQIIKKGHVLNIGRKGAPHYVLGCCGAARVLPDESQPDKSNGRVISPAVAKELAKPAPVAPRGAPETRILTPVVRRVDLTKPRLPDANAERRMEILGDPAPGRSAAENDFDPKTYLIRKGHTVCLDFGGALRIDGKRYERDEVISLVNSHRAKADLPPIVQGAA